MIGVETNASPKGLTDVKQILCNERSLSKRYLGDSFCFMPQQTTVERINHICIIILACVALMGALIYTRTILVPFVFAFFLYTILSSGVRWLRSFLHIQKWVSVSLMLFLLCLLFVGLFGSMISSVEEFVRGANQYQARFMEFLVWVERQALTYGFEWENQFSDNLTKLPLFDYAKNLTGSLVGFLGTSFLVLLMTFFMIIGERKGEIENSFLQEMHRGISSYISIKTAVSLITGFLVWLVLTFFHVEMAFLFGVLTVLLNYIPSLGSLIATVVPLPIILLQYGISAKAVIIVVLLACIQLLLGNVIEPKWMGENLDLHPVTVLVFLLFWGLVWGVPGMFLAVPITAMLKIILMRIEATRDWAEVLSGRIPK
jgi:AI-2 transport protein TqsA